MDAKARRCHAPARKKGEPTMKKSTSILAVLLAILFLPVLVVAKVLQLQK